MEVVGYGDTYEAARIDAQSKLNAARRDAEVGGMSGGLVALGFAGVIGAIWAVFNSALRPVAGTIFLAVGAAIIFAIRAMIIAAESPVTAVILALMIFVALIGLGMVARRALLRLESFEAEALYSILARSPLMGRIVHVLLYLYTAAASCVIAYALVSFVAEIFTDPKKFFDQNAPVAIGIIVAICASSMLMRYFSHPFARHLTLTGLPKRRTVAQKDAAD